MTQREKTVVDELIEAIAKLTATFEAHQDAEKIYHEDHKEMHRTTNLRIDVLADKVDNLESSRDKVRGAMWGWGALFMAATTILSVIAAIIGRNFA